MNDLLDPKVDFVFKRIFGSEENKDVLLAFLNETLKETENRRLTKIILVNSFIDKTAINDKLSVLDVRALTDDNKQVNLEIQLFNKHDIDKRTLYYWAKMYSGQLEEGQQYNSLRKTITINIVNFKVVPNSRYHNTFHLREDYTGHVLTQDIEIHFMELPKLEEQEFNIEDKLIRWLLFLKVPEKTKWEELAENMPELKKAMTTLEYLSQSREARALYEMRQKALMDEASLRDWAENAEKRGMEQGMEKGVEIGIDKGLEIAKVEFAKKLLAEGLDISLISRTTGLPIEEIEKLG
jgi:predicted transposase/invertase (TIGR01784 family)